jgi:protein-disulfide isomerase
VPLETAAGVHYNLRVSNVRISGHFLLALACAPLLAGSACEKKPAAEKPSELDTTPLPGVDVSKLVGEKASIFYILLGSLQSPCGKPESLRVSFTKDTSCKRAPFAVRLVASLLEDEAPEKAVREAYEKKYQPGPPVKLDTSRAPHAGATNGAVRIVEFFDYECPHCAAFKSVMEQVVADKGSDVSVSYLMFPLEANHPNARNAAQAALAAAEQGKFTEMHDKLFAEQHHTREDIAGFAKGLGLDLARFDQAYDAAAEHVTMDLKQGEAVGVNSTPTVYFNDHKYEGPLHPKYLEMWVDEELAVNR